MNATVTPTHTPPRTRWSLVLLRLAGLMLVAALVGWTLNHLAASMEQDARPAGFGRGALQGALMPMALPNLLIGRDVVIYSTNNTGVRYKLGYTAGVNVCGAVFFGFLFWRLRRLHKWASSPDGLANLRPRL